MFALVLFTIVIFIILFDWFPVNNILAWVCFFLCFGISTGASTAAALLKERMENKRMEEALERLKKEE